MPRRTRSLFPQAIAGRASPDRFVKENDSMGRYERLRGWTPATGHLSAPLLYDKGRAQEDGRLLPYPCEDWWKSPRVVWIETRRLLADSQGVVGLGGGYG